VDNLRGVGTDPRENGTTYLRASGANQTVFDDGEQDTLFGRSGTDWYFAHGVIPEISADVIADRNPDEAVN
jgi:Ca2+-binding RTX toxin-like protein